MLENGDEEYVAPEDKGTVNVTYLLLKKAWHPEVMKFVGAFYHKDLGWRAWYLTLISYDQ